MTGSPAMVAARLIAGEEQGEIDWGHEGCFVGGRP